VPETSAGERHRLTMCRASALVKDATSKRTHGLGTPLGLAENPVQSLFSILLARKKFVPGLLAEVLLFVRRICELGSLY
jgi:hypothetical protein